MKMSNFNPLSLFIFISPSVFSEPISFDASLFHGDVNFDKYMSSNGGFGNGAFNGKHYVDLAMNGDVVFQGDVVSSKYNQKSLRDEPCFSKEQIQRLGLKDKGKSKQYKECSFISNVVSSAIWEYDESNFILNINVPKSELKSKPKDYIEPTQWDKGINALFVRHSTNYYYNKINSNKRTDYIYSNLKFGMNIGLWQLRHDGYLRYLDGETDYSSLNSYIQRPLPAIESSLLFGESYTKGSMFGSVSYRGAQLSTDKRMWPKSQLGYAPEVHGVASTYAHVLVKQQGKIIKEIDVPPGPFTINDLNDTKSDGDLEVVIKEADGSVSSFYVPYSSIPMSVRPGKKIYHAVIGEVRGYEEVNNWFVEGNVQEGLNNLFTLNYGMRWGDGYQAYLAGGVVTTPLGAFGMNGIYSLAEVNENEYRNGWQTEINFGRSFNTGTNLSLFAYHYSSEGYIGLEDVLGLRKQRLNNDDDYYSYTLNQRNRFSVSLSQSLAGYGTLHLTGSLVDYYNRKESIDYQATYNNAWNNISYNITLGRQLYHQELNDDFYENTIAFGISIPFDFLERWSTLGFNYTHSKTNQSANTNVFGTLGSDAATSYSFYMGREGKDSTYGGSLTTKLPYGGFSLSSSNGDNYHRVSSGISGTMLIHSGGVTLGPYTSDSFALIEAKGAKGVKVSNGQGAEVDRFGYALHPSLSPYRYSDVSLHNTGLKNGVEIKSGSQRFVPYSGAIVKVKFETLVGKAVLIDTVLDKGGLPPMGADAYDQQNNIIGMVGQAGQVYARISESNTEIILKWAGDKECRISYTPPESEQVLFFAKRMCVMR